jgi:hypothetical protein
MIQEVVIILHLFFYNGYLGYTSITNHDEGWHN